jgi:hypothetical protein
MCCASLLETVRENSEALLALSRTGVFARGAGALLLSLERPKLYRRRSHENRRADCEIAARAAVFRLRPECPSAIPQGPYTRRPRRTVSSGSILMSARTGPCGGVPGRLASLPRSLLRRRRSHSPTVPRCLRAARYGRTTRDLRRTGRVSGCTGVSRPISGCEMASDALSVVGRLNSTYEAW